MKELETHPWEPFVPEGAKILIMGTFPPPRTRWSMDFYYPNRTNDFWKIMGLIFLNDPLALFKNRDVPSLGFNLESIRRLLRDKKIALNDTGHVVHRQKSNASDKFLEILEPVDLQTLLDRMPDCRAVATTGAKAADVVAELTSSAIPKMGEYVTLDSGLQVWRMPSTSRAYPLSLEKKAAFYDRMFRTLGII